MADFIKIEGVDGVSGADDTTLDEKGSKYLDALMGETGGEEASDASTEGGEAGKAQEGGAEPSKDAKPSDSSAKDGGAQPKPDDKGKEDKGKAASPNAGDLTLADGTVVKAGAERRYYDKARLAEGQMRDKDNQLRQANDSRDRLRSELDQLKNTVSSLQGAEPAVVSTGVKLVKDLQRDPAGTLKTLLTEAVAAGYTIEGIAQGIDVQSIRNAITEQVRPLLDQQAQQRNEQQSNQAIEQEVTAFYQQYPDATIHDDVIAAVIAKNPQMSLSEAYYQLRNAAIDRQLDWSKPLAPQMQASEQQQPQQQQQKPMPNGRAPSGQQQIASADRNVVAHESTSTGDIVKQAMREAGMKI